jgi:hypothetical protein
MKKRIVVPSQVNTDSKISDYPLAPSGTAALEAEQRIRSLEYELAKHYVLQCVALATCVVVAHGGPSCRIVELGIVVSGERLCAVVRHRDDDSCQ